MIYHVKCDPEPEKTTIVERCDDKMYEWREMRGVKVKESLLGLWMEMG